MFPTAFMPELISQESFNKVRVSRIFSIFYDINEVSCVLTCFGVFFVTFPIIFITIGIWMRSAARIINGQSHMQYRYQGFSTYIENSQQVAYSELIT